MKPGILSDTHKHLRTQVLVPFGVLMSSLALLHHRALLIERHTVAQNRPIAVQSLGVLLFLDLRQGRIAVPLHLSLAGGTLGLDDICPGKQSSEERMAMPLCIQLRFKNRIPGICSRMAA